MKQFLLSNARSSSPTSAARCAVVLRACGEGRSVERALASSMGSAKASLALGIAALLLVFAIPLRAGEIQISGAAPTVKIVGDTQLGFGGSQGTALGKFSGTAQGDSKAYNLGFGNSDDPPIILPVTPPHLPYLHRCKDPTDGHSVNVPDGDSGTLWSLICASLSLFAFRHLLRRRRSAPCKMRNPLEELSSAAGDFLVLVSSI
jgi:hypothetical protein